MNIIDLWSEIFQAISSVVVNSFLSNNVVEPKVVIQLVQRRCFNFDEILWVFCFSFSQYGSGSVLVVFWLSRDRNFRMVLAFLLDRLSLFDFLLGIWNTISRFLIDLSPVLAGQDKGHVSARKVSQETIEQEEDK